MTARGQKTLAVIALFGFLAMLAIGGAIETQAEPTCDDLQVSQDVERAWQMGCPFTDAEGNYLYTWTP